MSIEWSRRSHRPASGSIRHSALCILHSAFLLVLAMAWTTPSVGAQVQQKEPNLGGEIDLEARDPQVALSRLKVADGYEVNLFASEREFPELANPLAMTFDTRRDACGCSPRPRTRTTSQAARRTTS
jgi:hypothetical protein